MIRAGWFSSILVALLVCLMGSSQSPVMSAQTVDSSLQSIRTAIIQATGVPDASVDLKVTGKIFLVTRINSTLNQTNHSQRDGEASRIATVVAKMISDGTAYKNIHTIRVLYVATLRPGGPEKIIDTIDFRRDPSGVFHFHTT
jgi:hypothetical protein